MQYLGDGKTEFKEQLNKCNIYIFHFYFILRSNNRFNEIGRDKYIDR